VGIRSIKYNLKSSMNRRVFIKSSAFVFCALLAPANIISGPSKAPEAYVLENPIGLLDILSEDLIRDIGASYIKKFPQEYNEQVLTALLKKELHQNVSEESINKAIKNDFLDGDSITIRGWILARTEARQCALFSLSI